MTRVDLKHLGEWAAAVHARAQHYADMLDPKRDVSKLPEKKGAIVCSLDRIATAARQAVYYATGEYPPA